MSSSGAEHFVGSLARFLHKHHLYKEHLAQLVLHRPVELA
jgi:hypothetical protein